MSAQTVQMAITCSESRARNPAAVRQIAAQSMFPAMQSRIFVTSSSIKQAIVQWSQTAAHSWHESMHRLSSGSAQVTVFMQG